MESTFRTIYTAGLLLLALYSQVDAGGSVSKPASTPNTNEIQLMEWITLESKTPQAITPKPKEHTPTTPSPMYLTGPFGSAYPG